MNRPYLFMSGEFRVTMGIVFQRDNWGHTMSSNRLVLTEGGFRRESIPGEVLKGVVYYNRADSYQIEIDNLTFLKQNHIPCWPDPEKLLSMSDRHKVLKDCVEKGLVNHPIVQGLYEEFLRLPFPFVLKTGQEHRGRR